MRKALHAINLLRFAAGSHRPIIGPAKVTWEVTYRCNSRCRHCHIWQVKDHTLELATEEAKRMMRELADCGVVQISFTGGETFLRRDIFELIETASSLGLSTSVNTNGFLLDDIGGRLLESPVSAVYISLDGASAETHDSVRGTPGSFERALRAVRFLRQNRRGPKPRIFVNVTASTKTCSEMTEAVGVGIENGADGATLLMVQNEGKFTPDREVLPSRADVSTVQYQVAELKRRYSRFIPHPAEYLDNFVTFISTPNELYRYRCVAGFTSVLIRPNGEVCACPTGTFVLGNVRHSTFREIWFSRNAEEARLAIAEGRHPICWTDCVAPVAVMATYLRPRALPKLLNPAVLKHIAWRLRV